MKNSKREEFEGDFSHPFRKSSFIIQTIYYSATAGLNIGLAYVGGDASLV